MSIIFVGKSVGPMLVACVWWAFVCFLGGSTVQADTYIVQTRIVVDSEAFSKYRKIHYDATPEDLKKYITNKFLEISHIYENINGTNLTYQFEMTDFQVLPYYDQPLTADADKKVEYNKPIFDGFINWLKKNKKSDYDIAVLYTGFDIAEDRLDSSVVGQSIVDHVCQQDGVAIIELEERIALFTAHEIGHLLGATHDGMYNTIGDDVFQCYGLDGHVMNSNVAMSIERGNVFQFTECSAKLFESKLQRLDKEHNNCLKDGPRTAVISGPLPGSSMTVDDVCRKHFGQKSYFPRKITTEYGDSMCVTIKCSKSNAVPTPPGLRCGKSKQCIKGKCVVTPNGDPLMSDTCPYGEGSFCDNTFQRGECSIYKKICCYTCNPKNPVLTMTADDACRELHGKDAVLSRASYATYKTFCKKLHCLTGMDGDKPVIRTHNKAPDGLACGGANRCNDGNCVQSQAHVGPDTPEMCPYGDQPWVGDVTTSCQDIKTKNGCHGLETTCCDSCKGK